MGVRVEWGSYGWEAAERLRAEVASAKTDDPLSPVTVVVPSNHVGVATRRLLASGRLGPASGHGVGMAAVSFQTVYRLAELLAAARLAATGRRPVSAPVIAAAIRRVLAEDPGFFAPVANHPATEEALVNAYRELRDLSPGALETVAGASERSAEVVRVHRATRARLAPDWSDEEDLMQAAAELLTEGPAVPSLGRVVVYLPQRLSRHATNLLRALSATTELAVLAGMTGDPDADKEVIATVARLAPDAPFPSLSVGLPVGTERTKFVTTSDADEEVRYAVRRVVVAARAGVPFGRIALLHARPEPYARLVHEQLAAAGITANGAAVVPLTDRTAGRVLLRLLEWPAGGYQRWDLFAWLAASPVRHDERPVPVSSWERLSRTAAVVAGRDDWDRLLTVLAERFTADAERFRDDPERPEADAQRAVADADRTGRLRRFALDLIDDLEVAAAAPRAWADHADWARSLLALLIGGPAQQQHWAPAEQKAAGQVDAALDRLAAVGAIEGPVDLDVFARTLRLVLDADLGRVGRLGEGVLVGSVAMGVGLDLDLVVMLGVAEGSFPAVAAEDALLGDTDRAASGGELVSRRDRIDQQHRELLAVLAGARQQIISVPRGDLRRNAERVPSRWALDLASAMDGKRWWSHDLATSTLLWVEHVDSFDAGLRGTPFPATAQEYRLAALTAGGWDANDASDGPDVDRLRAGLVVAGRRSADFTRFDGNLAASAIPSPTESLTSASRLEQWTTCPFSYLLHYVLRVEPVEDPEQRLRISALDKGELVHEAMERFILEVIGRSPDPSTPWSEADRTRLAQISEELCDRYQQRGLTGLAVFWERDRVAITRDLQRVLVEDDRQRRQAGTTPVAAELGFGVKDAPLGSVALGLPDGRQVRFRGRADRVDQADDGTLHVIDYKTGNPEPYKKLSETAPVVGGLKLQLPIYGEAARLNAGLPDAAVRAEYWFVSTRGKFARVGYTVTGEVLRRAGEVLAVIVDGIEAGTFPHHPTAASTNLWNECPYCDPDSFGVGELRRSWERKLADPALSTYIALAEPDSVTGSAAHAD